MQNWGLITYSEDGLLVNNSQPLIAHEVVHQWFGNLVTQVRTSQRMYFSPCSYIYYPFKLALACSTDSFAKVLVRVYSLIEMVESHMAVRRVRVLGRDLVCRGVLSRIGSMDQSFGRVAYLHGPPKQRKTRNRGIKKGL